MFETVSNLLGGVGLFLLGMTLLSEGLRSFAGDSLRKALLTFTRRPVVAFLSGMSMTALIQSSSATTLMTIGFVSAGMLPFAQSVGVLMGGSLGTTSTGWIVSLVGLQVSVSSYALIFIAAGAAARLFLKGRWSAMGTALAGFGLVFLGIGLLQDGMAELTARIDFSVLPTAGLGARLLMVLIGLVLTVLMQSCSAVMATNLAALHSGALTFEQAAAMAIGAAIGTTVKAGIAAIGAGIHAKRSALALVLFNLSTGLIALMMFQLLLRLIGFFQVRFGLEEGAVSLAVFHSLFIAIGVMLFLPVIGPFSRFIERLLPEKSAGFTRYLDSSLQSLPAVALESMGRCLGECRAALAGLAIERIEGKHDPARHAAVAAEVNAALVEALTYLSGIEAQPDDPVAEARRVGDVHAIDHLQRLAAELTTEGVQPGTTRLAGWESQLLEELRLAATPPGEKAPVGNACGLSQRIAEWRREQRPAILQEAALAGSDPQVLLQDLDTIKWLDHIAYHLCRSGHHLSDAPAAAEPAGTAGRSRVPVTTSARSH